MKCGMGILDAMRDSVRDGGALPPAPPKPVSETQNKIADQIATFLRLGIAAWPLIADLGTKEQEISRKAPIPALRGTEKSPQSQKSCKETEIFVFTIEEPPQRGKSHKRHTESRRKTHEPSGRTNCAQNARGPAPTIGLDPV